MESIGKNIQDYFIKMAPDFSTFDLLETWFYKKGYQTSVPAPYNTFVNYKFPATTFHKSDFYRAMFLVYSTGTLTVSSIDTLDNYYIAKDKTYVVFSYREGTQIVIAVQNTPIKITSTTVIDRIMEVAF